MDNNALRNVYSSPNVRRVTKSRRRKRASYAILMEWMNEKIRRELTIWEPYAYMRHLKCKEKCYTHVNWAHLTYNMIHCRVLANTVMNLRVP
jgi:hypothetical protein